MTEPSPDRRTELAIHRGQSAASQLLAAFAEGDDATCKAICDHETGAGMVVELIHGLTQFGVSAALMVAERDDTLTADALFRALALRAETAITALAEIDLMTNSQPNGDTNV